MKPEPAGITRMKDAYEGRVWNILGQTYTLKHVTETSMLWYAEFPPGTFVPPHIHPTQDEMVIVLEGEIHAVLDGVEQVAGYGDTVRLPMGIPHGLFNKSDKKAEALFVVSPTGALFSLFDKIHNVGDPAEVVRLAAQHAINFLPPPAG